MKKILALLLASLLVISLFAGCAKQTNDTMKKDEQPAANGETAKENMGEKTDEMPMDAEKPTITFVHGYYHDESEWPAAAQMRQIYQDFADMHKDEFTFVAIPDESGAEGTTTQRSTTSAAASSMTSPTLAAGTSFPSQARPVLSLT